MQILSAFKVITRLNESETLKSHISCQQKFKFGAIKCNSNQKWNTINVDVSAKIRENIMCGIKLIFGMLVHVLETLRE